MVAHDVWMIKGFDCVYHLKDGCVNQNHWLQPGVRAGDLSEFNVLILSNACPLPERA